MALSQLLITVRVKQPSACCGAAAVAGALNCLGNMNRKHMSSLTHIDILNIYRTIMANSIAKKKTSFERCLGAPVDVFLSMLEADVFGNNVEQSRKRYATSMKEVLNSVRRLIAANKEGKEDPQHQEEENSEAAQMSAACNLLDELLVSENKEQEEEGEGGVDVVMSAGGEGGGIQEKCCLTGSSGCTLSRSTNANGTNNVLDEKEEEKERARNDDEAEGGGNMPSQAAAIIIIPGKKPKAIKRRPKKSTKFSKFANGGKKCGDDEEGDGETELIHNSWEWKKSLFEIMKKLAGLRKLEADKPSTACIGNWGILAGVQQLLELTDIGSSCLSARLFMGKGLAGPRCKVQVPLGRRDSTQQVSAQWSALRSAFADPNQVLLFHLKNHYALIFAVREWTVRCDGGDVTDPNSGDKEGSETDETGDSVRIVRQMYTARRGQRPAVWVDFSEARETMLAWEGYKIMSLQRQEVGVEGSGDTGDEEGASSGVGGQEPSSVAKLRAVKGLLEQHFPAQAWGGYLRHTHHTT